MPSPGSGRHVAPQTKIPNSDLEVLQQSQAAGPDKAHTSEFQLITPLFDSAGEPRQGLNKISERPSFELSDRRTERKLGSCENSLDSISKRHYKGSGPSYLHRGALSMGRLPFEDVQRGVKEEQLESRSDSPEAV